MVHSTLSLLLLAGIASAIPQNISISRSSTGETFAPGDVIFQDEFDSYLNTGIWHHEINMNGGYNGEFQIYDDYPDNVYVRDGLLYIRPTLSLDTVFGGDYVPLMNGFLKLEGCTDDPNGESCQRTAAWPYIHPPTVSTRLRTKGSFSFRYGKIEVRAKIPSGDWTWPAIWLLPEDERYGGWPASGEIDVMESRGNRKLFTEGGINMGSEQTASTLHYGPDPAHNGFMKATGSRNSPVDQGYDRDFHVFGCEWTENNLRFTVDDAEIVNIVPPGGGFWELGQFSNDVQNPWTSAENARMAPFDQNFHFILNVAVGGAFFPMNTTPRPPWNGDTNFLNFFDDRDNWLQTWGGESAAMAIDYIRVYAI